MAFVFGRDGDWNMVYLWVVVMVLVGEEVFGDY